MSRAPQGGNLDPVGNPWLRGSLSLRRLTWRRKTMQAAVASKSLIIRQFDGIILQQTDAAGIILRRHVWRRKAEDPRTLKVASFLGALASWRMDSGVQLWQQNSAIKTL